MNPKRRTGQIETLAAGIARIGPEFERFAILFLDALLQVPMTHAGTNLLSYPVAGVFAIDEHAIVVTVVDHGEGPSRQGAVSPGL